MHAYAVTCHCQHCITLTDSFQFGSKKKETTDRATEKKAFDNRRMLSTLIFDRKQMRWLCQKIYTKPKSWSFKKPLAFNYSAKRLEHLMVTFSTECGIESCNLKNAPFHVFSLHSAKLLAEIIKLRREISKKMRWWRRIRRRRGHEVTFQEWS